MPVLILGGREAERLYARNGASAPHSNTHATRKLPTPTAKPHNAPHKRPTRAAVPHAIDCPPFFPPPTAISKHTRARQDALSNCLAPKTLAGYISTCRRFWSHCEEDGVPVEQRFPASHEVLANFVASFAGIKAGTTAANAISALKAWHGVNNLAWAGDTQLPFITRGVANLAPPTSKRLKRPAVTTVMLKTLHDGLVLSDPADAAIFAAALLAFWGQCRLGELLGSARTRHNPLAHPSRSSLRELPSRGRSTSIFLPRTKTSGSRGETIHIPTQLGRADPIHALANHLKVNAGLPPSSHLFAFRNAALAPRCLTKELFLNRCNDLWTSAGFPRITGHSFRIGGTNAFLEAGVPSDVVRVKGRWKSDAYFAYWRNQDRLTATHTVRLRTHTARARSRLGIAGGDAPR